MKVNVQQLQHMVDARTAENGQEVKFPKLFMEKWLPEAGIATGRAPLSLLAPLHPEIYVFGPRIHGALHIADRLVTLMCFGDDEVSMGLLKEMRVAYQDEFGDINDYDWGIYYRYVSLHRLGFTTRFDRVYNVCNWSPTDSRFETQPGQVPFDVMLQEMMFYELYGPKMQGLKTSVLHQGAQRHAAFVAKWQLRK